MAAVVVTSTLGLFFLLLGRFGLTNSDTLVSASFGVERRIREVRSLRRGAWSCVAMGLVFGVSAVLQSIDAVLSS